MAFGLPSAEEIRDYLISQGVDPAVATERANVTARQNASQAARTSALSVLAGAAPARAAGTAAVEAAPAIARGAMGIGERIAAAPRSVWEYLTVPQGIVRNSTTGARIPTRNATTGRMERTPDYFLPGQQLAQGTTGAVALGGGAAGAGALLNRPTQENSAQQAAIEAARKMTDFDQSAPNTFSPEEAIRIASVRPEFNQTAPNTFNAEETAKITRAAAPAPRERAVPLPPARPEEFKARPGGLSSLFSDPYAGKSSRELYVMAQDPSMRDDEYGANLLNIRAARAGRDEGLATGGAATGKSGKMEKDAALHKALDIISHMLGRH
jgi:hypothetical protein